MHEKLRSFALYAPLAKAASRVFGPALIPALEQLAKV